ncbi:diacylglycerol kinase family protein [Streptomyces sp. GbtcB6]|uniref:diacylglycerol/lipid kinase family protein n=1 Tax=Streptomyces sp. GbtcB6 TaxID=2824751 RepID=UPI001C2FB9CF|nr:diacylglycerol kinase family protein [Streptomyces sp. GbtcB6]
MSERSGRIGTLRRVTVVANPAAGSTDAGYVSAVASLCSSHAEQVQVFWTRRPGHATELARRLASGSGPAGGRPDLIVAVGGDGTLREMAAGMVGGGQDAAPPLAVLPGGTGNSNYRSLWDDVPWTQALTAALSGVGAELRKLDLARIGDPSRLVLLGASTGISSAATAAARDIQVTGRSRYRAALQTIIPGYVPYPGAVTVDGVTVHRGPTVLVNVGGGRHRAGVFEILPHSVRDDGLLDVCVIGAAVQPAQALELMRSGAHLGRAGVVYRQGRTITVARTDGAPLLFESDGEVIPGERTSFTIEVVPNALPVLGSDRRPGG